MPKAELENGVKDWLNLTGESALYQSKLTGQSISIVTTLEQDVSVADDEGMIVNGLTLNISAADVAQPNRGDVVVFGDGRRFEVDMILDSPGHFVRVFVSPA